MNLLGGSSSLNPIFNSPWFVLRTHLTRKSWVLDREERINPEPSIESIQNIPIWSNGVDCVWTWLCRLYQTPIRIPQLNGSGCQVAHSSIFIYIICAVRSPHHCSGGVTWTSWINAYSISRYKLRNWPLGAFFIEWPHSRDSIHNAHHSSPQMSNEIQKVRL